MVERGPNFRRLRRMRPAMRQHWALGARRAAAGGARSRVGAPRRALSAAADFALRDDFLGRFRNERPPFGFNGLGEVVYLRTYSRAKPDGGREAWHETVERVVRGTFRMQQRWCTARRLPWDAARAQDEAQQMYELMFGMRFLPPGRGLWAMGSPLTEERGLHAALNNCAFVSTEHLADDPATPFCFLMDMAMLGVGVGFDTRGAGVPVAGAGPAAAAAHLVPDSREGWVDSLRALVDAHVLGLPEPRFDYSAVRPAGAPIRGFGGVSAGPQCLQDLHEAVGETLRARRGRTLDARAVVDVMNQIGRCVVAGNVRRTAEIAFGAADDEAYLDLKNYAANPERAAFGWASNNSVFARLGMDYGPVCRRVRDNGEPGFAWLDNMRAYGRMADPPDHADRRAMGGNPCLEQTLESYELCCLVETFPHRHDSLDAFRDTLDSALLYAKTVTLGSTHWAHTNAVMARNRRIGCSMTGLAQFVAARGVGELVRWADQGYGAVRAADRDLSERFGVPTSVKLTSVKPSGTVSLLAGATPGLHYPESRYYIRRVRIAASSELVPHLRSAGYHVEPASEDANAVVVEFPVDAGEGVRTAAEVPMWEQLSFAALLQRYWADNQVSATVTFDPDTEGPSLPRALDHFQWHLKGVSFLPRTPAGAFPQMPYEAIDADHYRDLVGRLRDVDITRASTSDAAPGADTRAAPDQFCDGDACSVLGGDPDRAESV